MSRRRQPRPGGPAGRGEPVAGTRPGTAGPSAERPAPPPARWRDPWAWASALAVLPLLAKSLGAPLGEPVAEDFDFLHRALLEGRHTLLDGGGSTAFWRPLAHQVYYLLVGPLLLRSPGLVAVLHVVLLGLAALLLYRALRPAWPGHLAAAAASFPVLAESTRTLISWPSHFVDLGLFLFSALALHEAARRRLPTALASLLAALLCKEVAIVTGLLLPWLPGPRTRRQRLRWALATGALLAAWGLVYLAVRRHVGLALPHHLEGPEQLAATPLATRLSWALGNSARAIFDLTRLPGPLDGTVTIAMLVLGGAALLALATKGAARVRLRARLPWVGWGLGWFLLASATLVAIHPFWAPNRSQFASLGLGVALAVLLEAAHPALLGALVALRLVLLGLSPGPPAAVSLNAVDRGAFMDFERLVRLQRMMALTRGTLQRRFPAPPHHAVFGYQQFPTGAIYAFGGSRALQVWYRDTTLLWLPADSTRTGPARRPLAIAEFEPDGAGRVALIDPEAARLLHVGLAAMREARPDVALADLDRAEAALTDSSARVFRGQLAGKRALVLAGLNRGAEAEQEALRSLALWRAGDDARLMLALLRARQGRLAEAAALLDTLIALYPDDRDARRLRAELPGGP
jgi:hypothetical protein